MEVFCDIDLNFDKDKNVILFSNFLSFFWKGFQIL